MELRHYQRELIAEINAEFINKKKLLIQIPIGSGKTITISECIKSWILKGERIVLLLHKPQLLNQVLKKFFKQNLSVKVIENKEDLNSSNLFYIISSETFLELKDNMNFDILIIDEVHHYFEDNIYENLIKNLNNKKILALTSTPCRKDGTALGQNQFDVLIKSLSISKLILNASLSDYKIFSSIDEKILEQGNKTIQGTENFKTSLQKINKIEIKDLIENWFRYAYDKQTIIIASNKEEGKKIADEYCASAINAIYIDFEDEDIDIIVRAFINKEIKIIITTNLLKHGYNCGSIECIQFANPNEDFVSYMQACNQALIPAEDKNSVIILDHSNFINKYGFPDDKFNWSLDQNIFKNNSKEENEEVLEEDFFEKINLAIKQVGERDFREICKAEGIEELHGIEKFIYKDPEEEINNDPISLYLRQFERKCISASANIQRFTEYYTALESLGAEYVNQHEKRNLALQWYFKNLSATPSEWEWQRINEILGYSPDWWKYQKSYIHFKKRKTPKNINIFKQKITSI